MPSKDKPDFKCVAIQEADKRESSAFDLNLNQEQQELKSFSSDTAIGRGP